MQALQLVQQQKGGDLSSENASSEVFKAALAEGASVEQAMQIAQSQVWLNLFKKYLLIQPSFP